MAVTLWSIFGSLECAVERLLNALWQTISQFTGGGLGKRNSKKEILVVCRRVHTLNRSVLDGDGRCSGLSPWIRYAGAKCKRRPSSQAGSNQ